MRYSDVLVLLTFPPANTAAQTLEYDFVKSSMYGKVIAYFVGMYRIF